MSLGLTIYTLVHVAISLIGIGSGFVIIWGLIGGKRLDGWTKLFLATTVLTSVTGFGFPVDHFMPSHALGIISLIVLAAAIVARYRRHLVGTWRWIYVVGAVVAQYLNCFVLIVESFQKSSRAQGASADAERAAVCHGSGDRTRCFHCAGYPGGR